MAVDAKKIQERLAICRRDVDELTQILFRSPEQERRHQDLIEEIKSLEAAKSRWCNLGNW